MIQEIAFVGYPTKNMKNARAFYEGVLGLVPTDEFGPTTDESEFIEYNIGTTTLSVANVPDWNPTKDGPSLALEMIDLDDAIAKLKENGVVFTMEKIETPACHMAMILDPDGNSILVHKRK